MTKDEVLALFVDDVKERKMKIRNYLKDHTNSYEDRKEVFLSTPEHLYNCGPWILHLPQFEKEYGELTWFDEFYAERYSDVDLVNIINNEDGDFTDWDEQKKEAFIKEVVDNGQHSFNLDW